MSYGCLVGMGLPVFWTSVVTFPVKCRLSFKSGYYLGQSLCRGEEWWSESIAELTTNPCDRNLFLTNHPRTETIEGRLLQYIGEVRSPKSKNFTSIITVNEVTYNTPPS